MCGFAGFLVSGGGVLPPDVEATLSNMASAIAHRGPDDHGIWFDAAAGIGLAHRRLSIVDLSAEGHQPMSSASGRYVTAYNGEVYNFEAIRQELRSRNPVWRGHSDTEVMLEAIEAWGLEGALNRFIGMFALALWDKQARELSLARDRVGIKPLYYGRAGGALLFASEMKALRQFPGFDAGIDRDSLAIYLRHNYIPAPYSIYKGIKKLLPGHFVTIPADACNLDDIKTTPYWSASKVAESSLGQAYSGSDQDAVAELDALLRDAVSMRIVADVPLGAFLSGGIDSSTVVAMMQAQSSKPVKTFSIGFHEQGYNEAHHAKAIARHIGTDHTELYVTPREAMDVIPELPKIYDEPFSDSSQIPTFLVSQLTRKHVTVSLSGDGGDELFGGYNRYFWGNRIWKSIGWMPAVARQAGGSLLMLLSAETWDKSFALFSPLLPKKYAVQLPGNKLHKLGEVLAVRNADELYLQLISHWKHPGRIVSSAHERPTLLTDALENMHLPNCIQRMMYFDLISYLPDDILTKVDRASMAVSLEARVPIIDHRIVEFAWRLPVSLKLRNGEGKWILRQVLDKYVPRKLLDRPKMGFGVPVDKWLRGPLREWAETLLDESRLRQEGYFDPAPIRQKWREHLEGRHQWHYYLWVILMFQTWLEEQ